MKNTWAIFQREMRSYFVSPVAYVVLTIFFFLAGLFFYEILARIVEQTTLSSLQSGRFGGPQPVNVPALVARSFFGVLSTILLFMIPMMTMGLLAEEKKRGTIELLLTSPLTNAQLVLGKFFASLGLGLIMILVTGLMTGVMFAFGDPDLSPILSGYLGLVLYLGSLLSLGLFISSLTENQIVAAVITFGVILLLWIVDIAAGSAGTSVKEVLSYLSVIQHLEDFTKGVVDLPGVVFYLSFTAVGLFLTHRSIESLRWRG
ncbi:MAG: ABC transporter permease subunit [Acidobacteria bacterium]|nr:ABC transporter permease subunit [Acidobacteriota bacterium]